MAPEGWRNRTLGSVLERVVYSVKPEANVQYREIGIRSHGKGIFHKPLVLGKELGDKRVFKVVPNCLVVNIVFAWEQAIARTTTAEEGMIASHRFPMYGPKGDRSNVDFLVYFFKSKRGKYLLELASPGGAGRNKTLGQKEFERLSLPMPSGAEQARIAKIISTWDKAIEVTEKLIANSKAQKKALMQQLLTGKKRLNGFSDDWTKSKWKDVFDIGLGGTPSRNKHEYWDSRKVSQNRWVSIADLRTKYIHDTKEYISDEGVKRSNVKLIPSGTVIVSFKLTIGRAAILTKSCFTNEAICALVPKHAGQIDTEYLYQAVAHVDFDKEIDQAIKGRTLNKDKLGRLIIPIPSPSEQLLIAKVLGSFDRQLQLSADKLALLKKEKDVLQQQLFSGKRRVKLDSAV